eukprot:CAMPEP_0185755144 /NCGR_PEP_ID=MMETSP1174-20130828/13674_1 /TAXON_ID=35687 /ORGANISM="Dictyocha speculum, Strain CCMP1381" /LENGTH=131 /DNA_ID=CAMNT_0028433589 /DNA_START=21 /DNA_END=416 /DNA_ORIENTATION=-
MHLERERAILLGTGTSVLAEAAPRDRIWGIGLNATNRDVATPCLWKGSNVLGWALMEAREAISNERQNVSERQIDRRGGIIENETGQTGQACERASENSASESSASESSGNKKKERQAKRRRDIPSGQYSK